MKILRWWILLFFLSWCYSSAPQWAIESKQNTILQEENKYDALVPPALELNDQLPLPLFSHRASIATTPLPLPRELFDSPEPIFTNDPERPYTTLQILNKPRDFTTFQPFEYQTSISWDVQYAGQDAQAVYPSAFSDQAIKIQDLSAYVPLQNLGIQAYKGTLWYSSGYLVLPPFQFVVDAETIRLYQQEQFENILVEYPNMFHQSWDRAPYFFNNGLQYSNYIGDDKDRVYFAPERSHIARIAKKPDFKILKPQEITRIFSQDSAFLSYEKNDWTGATLLVEPIEGALGVAYKAGYILLAYDGQEVNFLIDAQSMYWDADIPTLADKNFYYHIIYDIDSDWYEVERGVRA